MGEIQKKTKLLRKPIEVDKNKKLQDADDKFSRLSTGGSDHKGIKVDGVEIIDKTQEEVKLKVRLHNEKTVKVKETIQVYIRDMNSIYASLKPTLCTSEVIELNGQEERTMEIDMRPEAFMIIDEKGDCYRDSNDFEVYISTTVANDEAEMGIGEHPFIKKIHFQNIVGEF